MSRSRRDELFPPEYDGAHLLDEDEEFDGGYRYERFRNSPKNSPRSPRNSPALAKLHRTNSLSSSMGAKYDPAGAEVCGEKQWRIKISAGDAKKRSPKIIGVSNDYMRFYDSQGKEIRWEYPIAEIELLTKDPAFGLLGFLWKPRDGSHPGEQILIYSKKYCADIFDAFNISCAENEVSLGDDGHVGLAGSIYKKSGSVIPDSPKGLGKLVGRPPSPSPGVKEIPTNSPLLTDPGLASPRKSSPRNSPRTPRNSEKIALTLSRKGNTPKISRPVSTYSPQVQKRPSNPLSRSLDFLAPVPQPENDEMQYKRF